MRRWPIASTMAVIVVLALAVPASRSWLSRFVRVNCLPDSSSDEMTIEGGDEVEDLLRTDLELGRCRYRHRSDCQGGGVEATCEAPLETARKLAAERDALVVDRPQHHLHRTDFEVPGYDRQDVPPEHVDGLYGWSHAEPGQYGFDILWYDGQLWFNWWWD